MKLIGLIISLTLVFADSNTQTELDIHLYENDCENNDCLNWTITIENEGDIFDEKFDLTTDYDSYTHPTSNEPDFVVRGNHVGSSLQGGANFTFGYGKYKITYQSNVGGTHVIYVDFGDCNYPYNTGLTADMIINYYYNTNLFKYNFNGTEYNISAGSTVHIWDQPGGPSSPETYCFNVTPVGNLSWSNYNNKVKLNWNSSGNGINYDVWRSINGGQTTLIANSISNTHYVDNNVQVCCGNISQTNVYEVFAEFQGTTPSNAGPLTVITKIKRLNKTGILQPEEFIVENPFPNPFNPIVNIDYEIPEETNLQINIYSITGELVYSQNSTQIPGFFRFTWDGNDKEGQTVSSGIYIISFKTKNYNQIRKVIYTK